MTEQIKWIRIDAKTSDEAEVSERHIRNRLGFYLDIKDVDIAIDNIRAGLPVGTPIARYKAVKS